MASAGASASEAVLAPFLPVTIYSYILFLPHFEKHRCTWPFVVGVVVFLLTVLLQVSLVVVVGKYILSENSEFKNTLIHLASENKSYTTVHDAVDDGMNVNTRFHAMRAQVESLGDKNASSSIECCKGAACAGSAACCRKGQSEAIKESDADANGTDDADNSSTGERLDYPDDPVMDDYVADDDNQHSLSLIHRPRAKGRKSKGKRKTKSRQQRGGFHGGSAHEAICQHRNGSLVCAPPSLDFVDAWADLDTDGDGVWTVEEAEADSANLGCRLGLPVDEVFRHVCRGIIADAMDSAKAKGLRSMEQTLPNTVLERSAVPKDYFRWWTGLAALCSHHDPVRCGQLIRQGSFDLAMQQRSPGRQGGITDLDTALEYCQRVLIPGGLCDAALPGSFIMFRDRVKEKCGRHVDTFGERVANPTDPKNSIFIMDVSYTTVEDYENVQTWKFRIFLTLILILWYMHLMDQCKDVVELGDFCWGVSDKMRSESSEAPDNDAELAKVEGSDTTLEIIAISRRHRCFCVGILLVRAWLLVYIANVGTAYLLSTHSFVDLLLNAVALAFIFELPEILYRCLISDESQKNCAEVEDGPKIRYRYPSLLPQRGWSKLLVSRSFWGLIIIPCIAILVVKHNTDSKTAPVLEALRCACELVGERCLGQARFPKTWWDQHWVAMGQLPMVANAVAPATASLAQLRPVGPHAPTLGGGLMQVSLGHLEKASCPAA